MPTLSDWNNLLEQFIENLIKAFPDEPSIKKYQSSFELLRKSNPRKVLETVMPSLTPYMSHILQKDESFLLDEADNNEFTKQLNFRKYWNPELSDNNKEIIWQYLQGLMLMGTQIMTESSSTEMAPPTIPGLPANLGFDPTKLLSGKSMNQIDSAAKELEKKFEETGEIDQDVISGVLSSVIGDFMKQQKK
jgi:hypothetical protein